MATLQYDRARYDTKMRTVTNYLRFIGADEETTMRIIKFYAWELPFKAKIEEIRRREMKVMHKHIALEAGNHALWNLTPLMVGTSECVNGVDSSMP